MKLVIDISEQAYELFKGHTGMAFAFELDYDIAAEVEWAIKNGKLLQDVLKEETKGGEKMTELEALKIARWRVVDDLCSETSKYCGESCIECEQEVRKVICRMIARKENEEVRKK